MKVCLYARVSTGDQDTDVQRYRLEEYAKLQGWEVFDYFKDEVSGANDSRPGLDAMLEAAGISKDGIRGRPKFDAIVITKLDRIMRSLVSLELLIKKLDKQKVSLIVMDQGIDTGADGNDDTKRLIRQILGAVAEWERGMIRTRVKEGMAKAKKYGTRSGKPIGRAPTFEDWQLQTARTIKAQEPAISWSELERRTGICRRTLKRELGPDGQRGEVVSL